MDTDVSFSFVMSFVWFWYCGYDSLVKMIEGVPPLPDAKMHHPLFALSKCLLAKLNLLELL